MCNERVEAITNALVADKEHLKDLFEMRPEDAANALKAKGYDFTAEELTEYGKLLDTVKKEKDGEELDENALEDVAGGGLITAALLGVAVGYWIYSKNW